ncbi:hypothetical protein TIFTF001_028537 [Ficus carica]|uniref:Uncharacterized protein n=1 Tax=Ficus carica TaxID=3494 RepID=A0AA88J1W3_FICCA|nr:hypothetical protein TIFTF001_028537 [Ficus carica]
MARSRTSSAYSPRPTQRRQFLESPEMDSKNDSKEVQKLDIVAKCKDTSEKLTRWNRHVFILPLMLLPFECIPVLTPTYAEIREDVKRPVPRICRWKTKFHRQQAPSLEQILHAVGDSMNIKSILVPTLEEQKANYMKGFVPYYDDPDAISTPQEGTTAAEQTRNPPSNPTVNESIPPQASSHADNSMVLCEIQALKQTVEKMCTEHESRFSQLEKLITENGNCVDMLTNIVSRFVQQQSETWKGGDRGESNGGGCEHSRGVDVRIIAGGDIEA